MGEPNRRYARERPSARTRPLQRSGHVLISLMESMYYKMEAAISSGLPPFGWPKGLSQPARRATKTETDPSTHGAPRSRFHERPPVVAAAMQEQGRGTPLLPFWSPQLGAQRRILNPKRRSS